MGFDKVAERIYNYPEVNSVYLISGGFDFMVTIEGKTLREVSQLFPINFHRLILF